eukprot:5623871-Heterocapsa_arctica.AAC.1
MESRFWAGLCGAVRLALRGRSLCKRRDSRAETLETRRMRDFEDSRSMLTPSARHVPGKVIGLVLQARTLFWLKSRSDKHHPRRLFACNYRQEHDVVVCKHDRTSTPYGCRYGTREK